MNNFNTLVNTLEAVNDSLAHRAEANNLERTRLLYEETRRAMTALHRRLSTLYWSILRSTCIMVMMLYLGEAHSGNDSWRHESWLLHRRREVYSTNWIEFLRLEHRLESLIIHWNLLENDWTMTLRRRERIVHYLLNRFPERVSGSRRVLDLIEFDEG